jgi:hypothetical protein
MAITQRAKPAAATKSKISAAVDKQQLLGAESGLQRSAMIAEAAYFKARERRLSGGLDDAISDWLQAEAEIDALLAGAASCDAGCPDTDNR